MADGEAFGRYRLLEELRWAGAGTVYRARDTMMTRDVALKVLPAESAGDPEYRERFRSEVSIAAQLNNPNVIPVYEAGEIDGRLYLVMPILDGIDARSLLDRDGAMSPALAVRVIEQAAVALESAHRSGLVHGDVKPSNLFVVGGEFVYLIDFGAHAAGAAVDSGSWPYLAPERLRSQTSAPGAAGDIYALACVLHECLTGQQAVRGDSLEEIAAAHLHGAPPKPCDIDPSIPVGFDDVVARGMAKNPDDRYQSAREFARAARAALTPAGGASAVSADQREFGRYHLLQVLGAGGMGAVYRARDTELHRDVAVKLLQPGLAVEPGYEERFRREAYAAGRLASPNIIPIYEAGEVDGRLYLVMPIINGVDVHTVLQRDGAMDPDRAVRVIEQVAGALEVAHKSGLVHRDVKPSNLLMVDEDFVYLIDFGLVHDSSAARLTVTNIAPGTPAYMAPERFTSGSITDARADVYSLACVLYECLTGQLPFAGDSIGQLVGAHLSTDPPRPSSCNPALAGFDNVIARGMAKDPDARYQSASELAVAARKALTDPGEPTPAPIDDPVLDATMLAAPQPRRNRRRVVAAAAALLVVACGAAFLVTHNRSRPTQSAAQTVLPFSDLDGPLGITVDAKGTVYVTDTGHNRVVQLATGSTEQTVAPFSGLDHPTDIAVDNQGTVVVGENRRVLQLTAGSTDQTVLPFAGLAEPSGVAISTRGPDLAVYVVDSRLNKVLTLRGPAVDQTELPFTGLNHPSAVALDGNGTLFIVDRNNERVIKLPATATVATVLSYAVGRPEYIAVDADDDLYVTDTRHNSVLKLVKASNTMITLPFQGLSNPQGVAVDAAGNVYVVDSGNNRVLKLPPS